MWAMAFLVVIPIARYLVFTDKIAPFDEFLDLTVRPVELCSILGVIQLFKFVAENIPSLNSTFKINELTAIVTLLATIAYILGFELIFKKYRFSWGTLFFFKRLAFEEKLEISLDDPKEVIRTIQTPTSTMAQLRIGLHLLKLSFIQVIWGQTAFHLLKDSLPERDDELVKSQTEFVGLNRKEPRQERIGFWFVVAVSTVILPVLFVIAWILSIVFTSSIGQLLLAMVIMRLTKHIVGLSYIAFGTMDYEQFVTNSNTRWIIMIAFYTACVYLLFF